MSQTPLPDLPDDLRDSLSRAFVIRFTSKGRRTGAVRTTETTFAWDGGHRLIVSGYPGRRDWVANIAADPRVTVHTVQGAQYDIPAFGRVLRSRDERTGPLIAFIERWATRPGGPRTAFVALLWAVHLNRRLHLPWWGPFYLIRRVMDRMPCVELTLTGTPIPRRGPPPRPSRIPPD